MPLRAAPRTRDGRTCCCAGEDTVNNRAKMSSATRRASSPQRGPRISQFRRSAIRDTARRAGDFWTARCRIALALLRRIN